MLRVQATQFSLAVHLSLQSLGPLVFRLLVPATASPKVRPTPWCGWGQLSVVVARGMTGLDVVVVVWEVVLVVILAGVVVEVVVLGVKVKISLSVARVQVVPAQDVDLPPSFVS